MICRAWFSLFGISSPPILSSTDGVAVPEIVLEENTDIEAWDAVIENNDGVEKYIAGEPISREKLAGGTGSRRLPVPSLSWQRQNVGIQPLMDAVTGLFQPIGEQGRALCGSVFKG